MAITQEIFEAYLHCPTKCHLVTHGIEAECAPQLPQFTQANDTFRSEGVSRMCAHVPADEIRTGFPTLIALKQQRYRLVVDCGLLTPSLAAQVHGFHLFSRDKRAGKGVYTPFRFVTTEKLCDVDRMLLAFDALVFSQAFGTAPPAGEIIHGREYTTTKVPLASLHGRLRSALQNISRLLADPTPPAPVLNKHCAECQFAWRCARIAKEMDDLSLLSKMSDKERQRFHERGIFTVTQLSHTFRYRRRVGKKHDHALKALAIRKKQIHLIGKVTWTRVGTPVYIDVENDPDRGFYYCIGIRFESAGAGVQWSFWADDPTEEEKMWTECMAALSTIENPRLVHYGSFETLFLRQMKKRYPTAGSTDLLSRLMESAVNLLSIVYAQVYFPTYSNSLKDIAQYLGFSWSEPVASGLMALQWRRLWEHTREKALKRRLLTYNAEDCAAAEVVAQALSSLSSPDANVVDAGSIKREFPQRFGKNDFALPEFQQINDAARWDYQRDKVSIRTGKHSIRSRLKADARVLSRMARVVKVAEERPTSCTECGSTEIKRWGWLVRVVHDLKLSRIGVKRWVVRYSFPRYICWQCRKTFHKFTTEPGKYGATIRAYVAYQVIELQLSQGAAARSLVQIFNIPASPGTVNRLKADEASRYTGTYQAILEKIVRGPVVYADETKAKILGKQGYVWVFANSEEVVFVFSQSREASTPQTVLEGFSGVLVSDFYTAYDSIACLHQKCLIHLMRDINEDLCKQPFNEEMKEIARQFANLLRPIILSVDRFGLRARHLRRHQSDVDRFYKVLLQRACLTDVAAGYQRRFERNRDRLFTFLDHDGVAWNNNNAEHAIKAFARLRNIIGGTSTEKGLHEYLILLSINETCKNKGIRFLDFLLSQESDVDRFVSRTHRRR
jgi:predicted RecB family nuclease